MCVYVFSLSSAQAYVTANNNRPYNGQLVCCGGKRSFGRAPGRLDRDGRLARYSLRSAMIFSPLALIASPFSRSFLPSLSLRCPFPSAAAPDHRQIRTKEMMIDVRDEICSGEGGETKNALGWTDGRTDGRRIGAAFFPRHIFLPTLWWAGCSLFRVQGGSVLDRFLLLHSHQLTFASFSALLAPSSRPWDQRVQIRT